MDCRFEIHNTGSVSVCPGTNSFRIDWSETESADFQMLDLFGKVVLEDKIQPGINYFEVETLPASVYIVVAKTEESRWVSKWQKL